MNDIRKDGESRFTNDGAGTAVSKQSTALRAQKSETIPALWLVGEWGQLPGIHAAADADL